jgi:hypothetical protein
MASGQSFRSGFGRVVLNFVRIVDVRIILHVNVSGFFGPLAA